MSLVEFQKVLLNVWDLELGSERGKTTANRHMIHVFWRDSSFTRCGRGCGIRGGERWEGDFGNFDFLAGMRSEGWRYMRNRHIAHLLLPCSIYSPAAHCIVCQYGETSVVDCVGLLETENWGSFGGASTE
jgi:hypothetical protein